MLFTSTGHDQSGDQVGVAVNTQGSPAAWICQLYSGIAARLARQEDDHIHAVVVADPWPFADGAVPKRRLFHADDMTGIAAALAAEERRDVGEQDVVALLPQATLDRVRSADDVLSAVVFDLAAWSVENMPGQVTELLWAGPVLCRAVIAARLLRGAEAAGLVDAWVAGAAYREVCAMSLAELTEDYEENGEALLSLESPGLIAFLHRMVEHVRLAPPPALPLGLYEEAEAAQAMLRAGLQEAGPTRRRVA